MTNTTPPASQITFFKACFSLLPGLTLTLNFHNCPPDFLGPHHPETVHLSLRKTFRRHKSNPFSGARVPFRHNIDAPNSSLALHLAFPSSTHGQQRIAACTSETPSNGWVYSWQPLSLHLGCQHCLSITEIILQLFPYRSLSAYLAASAASSP